jgi:hypothetical protein
VPPAWPQLPLDVKVRIAKAATSVAIANLLAGVT